MWQSLQDSLLPTYWPAYFGVSSKIFLPCCTICISPALFSAGDACPADLCVLLREHPTPDRHRREIPNHATSMATVRFTPTISLALRMGCCRAEAVFVIDGLRLIALQELKPQRRIFRMRSIPDLSGSVDGRRVLFCRNRDSLDRIVDAFLKADLRTPGHACIQLPAQDPHRCLAVVDLGQPGVSALYFVLIHTLVQRLAASFAQRCGNLLCHAFPFWIGHGQAYIRASQVIQ